MNRKQSIVMKAAYTVAEAATILGLSVGAARELVRGGDLPSYMVTATSPPKRRRRVPYGALRDFVRGDPRYKEVAKRFGP
jgi:excisionase family DNA binding protein